MTPKPVPPAAKKTRVKTVFDLARDAQRRLDALEIKKQQIRDELPAAALALLDALDQHHAQQPIEDEEAPASE